MGLQREPLQFPIVHALWLGGLLGGVVIGRRTQRIGFLESLWVVFLVSCLPALFYKDLSSLFTYGTAAAYFVSALRARYPCRVPGHRRCNRF